MSGGKLLLWIENPDWVKPKARIEEEIKNGKEPPRLLTNRREIGREQRKGESDLKQLIERKPSTKKRKSLSLILVSFHIPSRKIYKDNRCCSSKYYTCHICITFQLWLAKQLRLSVKGANYSAEVKKGVEEEVYFFKGRRLIWMEYEMAKTRIKKREEMKKELDRAQKSEEENLKTEETQKSTSSVSQKSTSTQPE